MYVRKEIWREGRIGRIGEKERKKEGTSKKGFQRIFEEKTQRKRK